MKTLEVITIGKKDTNTIRESKVRGKLVVIDSEIRPEYIEVDNTNQDSEPIVRVNFADNFAWSGTMEELKAKLQK